MTAQSDGDKDEAEQDTNIDTPRENNEPEVVEEANLIAQSNEDKDEAEKDTNNDTPNENNKPEVADESNLIAQSNEVKDEAEKPASIPNEPKNLEQSAEVKKGI